MRYPPKNKPKRTSQKGWEDDFLLDLVARLVLSMDCYGSVCLGGRDYYNPIKATPRTCKNPLILGPPKIIIWIVGFHLSLLHQHVDPRLDQRL